TSLLAQLVGRGTQPRLDWSGDLTLWSRAAANATTNIVQALQDTLGNQPQVVDRFIALGFPNPNNPGSSGGWNHVSPERAKAVWDALADPSKTTLSVQLLPSDIWSTSGAFNVLV